MQVLVLLEAFVKFICCNDGSFLRTIVSGSMARSLRERGAPDSLIKTFAVRYQSSIYCHYIEDLGS